MARYDRIARIPPPPRDRAFTGWLVLRDLDGRERDPDLGRRARLRFLAVRLVHRLAGRLDGVDAGSLQRQCDAVREELGQLPGRDPERHQLAEFLHAVSGSDMGAIVRGAFGLGDAYAQSGYGSAAEEFYRAGVELAHRTGLAELGGRGTEALATLFGAQA